ncbi:MAG: MBL fold metallo-hydrolase [Sulfolobales archaeon]
MVRLYFLGLGGWASNPLINHTSMLLVAKQSRILVDVGECVYNSLRICTPFDVGDLDYVVITHRHGDHLLGLPTILQHAKRLGVRVRVVGPYDVYEAIKGLLGSIGIPNYVSLIDFTVVESGVKLSLGGISVTAIEASHTIPALMFRFDVDGKCVAYSGDSSLNANFVSLINRCDVLVHEASVDDEFKNEALKYGHSTVDDAVRTAEEAGVKRLVLVHRGLSPLTLLRTKVPVVLVHKCDVLEV